MTFRLIVILGLLATLTACAEPSDFGREPKPAPGTQCPDHRPGNGDETDGGVGGTGNRDGQAGKPRC